MTTPTEMVLSGIFVVLLAWSRRLFKLANYTAPTIIGHFWVTFPALWGYSAERFHRRETAACGRRRGGILANMVQVGLLVQISAIEPISYGHIPVKIMGIPGFWSGHVNSAEFALGEEIRCQITHLEV
jgi:hypothetical protein